MLEITHLSYNAAANAVGKALITGFSQVAKSEKIRNYFIKGEAIAEKFIELLNKVLLSEDVSIAPSYESEVMKRYPIAAKRCHRDCFYDIYGYCLFVNAILQDPVVPLSLVLLTIN